MRPPEIRYAQALFEVFKGETELNNAADFLLKNSAVWTVLTHPGVQTAEKHRLLDRILHSEEPVLLNFFKLLCDKERMNLLPLVVSSYHALCLNYENSMDAVMRCAFLPEAADLKRLEKSLCELHNKDKVNITVRQETNLIGGFVLEAEGKTYDRSLKGALGSLKNTLKAR